MQKLDVITPLPPPKISLGAHLWAVSGNLQGLKFGDRMSYFRIFFGDAPGQFFSSEFSVMCQSIGVN